MITTNITLKVSRAKVRLKPCPPIDRPGGVTNSPKADVRYLVAAKRYEATKEIRSILRYHFEDAFQSPEQVHDVVKQLEEVAKQINATVQVLLTTDSSISYQPSAASPNVTRAEGSITEPKAFDRRWKLQSDENDLEVVNFSSWASILLHLMVHKAFCVLYHPLFKDATMVSSEAIRTRFSPPSHVDLRIHLVL
jgi:hypothetical protein